MDGEPLRVVLVSPDKGAAATIIPHTLEALQGVVGGYIEYFRISAALGLDPHIHGICNEDGIAKQLPFNVYSLILSQAILGTFFISKTEDCDLVSLTEDEADVLVALFNRGVPNNEPPESLGKGKSHWPAFRTN